jgi:hypothetical protein
MGYLTNFENLKPGDTFQHNERLYIKIWDIKVSCCGDKFYNAVDRKTQSIGYTFQKDDLVEKV